MSSSAASASVVSAPEANNEEESLPFFARVINHILTPGSSLSPVIWISFNVIMFLLFAVWLTFVYAMPSNVHVWVFGVLGVGLVASTNWLMKLIFSSGLDYASQQKQQQQQTAVEEPAKDEEEKKHQ